MATKNEPRELKARVIIQTERQCYSPEQVNGTMTVGELKKLLEEYEEDSPIYLSFDNGYTYGGLNHDDFEEECIDEGTDEDDE